MIRSKLTDLVTAAAPQIGAITVAEFNQAAQSLGALAGFAYLVWKWRRDAKISASVPIPK